MNHLSNQARISTVIIRELFNLLTLHGPEPLYFYSYFRREFFHWPISYIRTTSPYSRRLSGSFGPSTKCLVSCGTTQTSKSSPTGRCLLPVRSLSFIIHLSVSRYSQVPHTQPLPPPVLKLIDKYRYRILSFVLTSTLVFPSIPSRQVTHRHPKPVRHNNMEEVWKSRDFSPSPFYFSRFYLSSVVNQHKTSSQQLKTVDNE